MLVSSFETGGVAACVGTGIASDTLITLVPRLPIIRCSGRLLLSLVYLTVACFALERLLTGSTEDLRWACILLGISTYGNINIMGMLAVESAPRHLSGTAHAFVALASQGGSIMLVCARVADLYSVGGALAGTACFSGRAPL